MVRGGGRRDSGFKRCSSGFQVGGRRFRWWRERCELSSPARLLNGKAADIRPVHTRRLGLRYSLVAVRVLESPETGTDKDIRGGETETAGGWGKESPRYVMLTVLLPCRSFLASDAGGVGG